MTYSINIALSIPMAIIIYMLTEKMIITTVSDKEFGEKTQSNFIIGFVTGLAYIALAMTLFSDKGVFDNQVLQMSLYGAGTFFVLNSLFFSWDVLDEQTKMMLLAISVTGLVLWSYTLKRVRNKKKKKNKKNIKSNKSIRNRY